MLGGGERERLSGNTGLCGYKEWGSGLVAGSEGRWVSGWIRGNVSWRLAGMIQSGLVVGLWVG